jgi:plastocyanin
MGGTLRAVVVGGALVVALGIQIAGQSPAPPAAAAQPGTIVGHVRLTGPAPANPPIRMGVDPVCASLSRTTRVVQEFVLRDANGGLANSFVNVEGSFPKTPPPSQPVTITQQNCIYAPRMVAARVGQTLIVINRDATLHNVHTVMTKGNVFNITQPNAGNVFSYVLKAAEIIRLRCEVHSWMMGYVGVVDHPYFAMTKADGSFTIARVPAGRRTIHVWHEAFGDLTRTVVVKPGETVTVDFAYTNGPKKAAALHEVVVPDLLMASAGHAD